MKILNIKQNILKNFLINIHFLIKIFILNIIILQHIIIILSFLKFIIIINL